MKITINNKQEEISAESTVQDIILKELGNNTGGIAVAVNQSVVPKTAWPTTELKINDNILIIKATQGG